MWIVEADIFLMIPLSECLHSILCDTGTDRMPTSGLFVMLVGLTDISIV